MICVSSDVVGVIGGAHGILVLSSILYSLSEQWKKENPPIQILGYTTYTESRRGRTVVRCQNVIRRV